MKTRLFNGLVVLLAVGVALSTPLQYLVALRDPGLARYFGLDMLATLPAPTLSVVFGACILQSALMAYVVVELARVILSFQRGQFFTRAVVRGLWRIGGALVGIAVISVCTLVGGLITAAFASDLLAHLPWWAHLLNLPLEMLVTGCVVLLVAGAFDRACKMADDERYTV